METTTDAALMNTTAGQMGAWFGAFIIPMAVAYILLRIAGSPKRKPSTAVILRVLAVVTAGFLAYAGYIGGGGQLNPGSLVALVITVVWAAVQQFRGRAQQAVQPDRA